MNALFFVIGVLAVIGYFLGSIVMVEQAEKLGLNIRDKDSAILILTASLIMFTAFIIAENQ